MTGIFNAQFLKQGCRLRKGLREANCGFPELLDRGTVRFKVVDQTSPMIRSWPCWNRRHRRRERNPSCFDCLAQAIALLFLGVGQFLQRLPAVPLGRHLGMPLQLNGAPQAVHIAPL